MSTVRVNENIKKEVTPILNNLGLSLSEAINMYLHQIKLHEGLPFEVKMPHFSTDLLEAIEEAEEIEKHPEKYKKFHSVKELMEDLENE